jgi:hypothetical protein
MKDHAMKNLPTVFAVAALLLSTPLWAHDDAASKKHNAQIADMCATGKCQRNLHVVLKEKTGASFDRTFETFPAVVQPIGFVVVAGQTVYVEADVVDGKLVNVTAVEKISDPGKTITATFEQVDGKDMVLTISNPYRKPLKASCRWTRNACSRQVVVLSVPA